MAFAHRAGVGSVSTTTWLCGLGLAALLCTPATRSQAADDSDNSSSKAKAAAETIDMFDGMKNGDLDVKFFPRNSREAQIVITNNTDKPLNVRLPDAFAGVPVLAQAVGNGAGGGNRTTGSGSRGGNQNQGTGGGGGNGGVRPLGGNNGGGGGGAFNVPPEKTIKIKVAVVCLDHGKDEPNAHIPYEIRPIESYNSDPAVAELCKLLGSAKVDQRSAQAAAWHLANHMSWAELSNLKRFPNLPAYTKPYFTPEEIRTAMVASDQAEKAAEAHKLTTPATPSSSASASTTAVSNGAAKAN